MARPGRADNEEAAAEIGVRLKLARERLGKTQGEFADEVGVSRSFLSEMESGKAKPSVTLLIGAFRAFPAINRDWLVTGQGPMAVWDKKSGEDHPWSGSLRLYNDVSLANADTDALRCAVHCLDRLLKDAPDRRDGAAEREAILTFYARYIGAYQDAMRLDASRSDPRSYAEADCLIYAEKTAVLHWVDDAQA